MSEKQLGQENKTDDLDLIVLLEKTVLLVRNYGRLLAIFSVAGMLTGYALFTLLPRHYSSTLLLHSATLTNTEQINIIENWNALLKDGDYTALGERLNCSPLLLEKIDKLSAAEVQKLYTPNNPNGFEVTAIVRSNTVLDSLAKGIVFGLENGTYVKTKLMAKQAMFRDLIEKVTVEIDKLSQTQKNMDAGTGVSKQYASPIILDASAFNVQMIGLTEKLLDYQDRLKFEGAVQVLHPFEKFEKPINPKLFKSLVLGFIGGFAIGYLFAVYQYLRKRFLTQSVQLPAL